jgi:hypothetical protein
LEPTFSKCEEWQRSLYVIEEFTTTSWRTGKSLLQMFIETC